MKRKKKQAGWGASVRLALSCSFLIKLNQQTWSQHESEVSPALTKYWNQFVAGWEYIFKLITIKGEALSGKIKHLLTATSCCVFSSFILRSSHACNWSFQEQSIEENEHELHTHHGMDSKAIKSISMEQLVTSSQYDWLGSSRIQSSPALTKSSPRLQQDAFIQNELCVPDFSPLLTIITIPALQFRLSSASVYYSVAFFPSLNFKRSSEGGNGSRTFLKIGVIFATEFLNCKHILGEPLSNNMAYT